LSESLLNIFLIIFSLLNRKNARNNKFNLIYAPVSRYPNINQQDIRKFLKTNNLLFRNNCQNIIFEGSKSFKTKYFQFSSNAFLYLCLNFLSRKDRVFIIIEIIKNIIFSIVSCFNSKLFIFIYEGLNELVIYEKVKKQNILEEIFIYSTTSTYKLFMFMEQDSIKKSYIFDSVNDFYEYSTIPNKSCGGLRLKILGLMGLDKCLLVDKYCEDILRLHVNSKVKISKSDPPTLSSITPKILGKNNICLFDVNGKQNMPLVFTQNLSNKLLLNNSNFKFLFDINNIKNFIRSTLEIINKINKSRRYKVKCFIKYKFSTSADKKAILHYYKKLEKKYSFFRILDSSLDLEATYDSFKTVISYPYTSTSHFFNHYTKRKSIYFDTSGLLKKNYMNKNIFLASDMKQLETILRKYI